ncbi:MAG: hypothetical protein HY020_10800 [Burkholderiales bacterium]|nr:hypothetical protein [Burkholderiales bacterium]
MLVAKQLTEDWAYAGGFSAARVENAIVGGSVYGTASVTQDLSLPTDAVITAASAVLSVGPADRVSVGDAAQVRAESSAVLIVDLGGLRTVAGLRYAAAKMTQVQAWQGTRFGNWFASEDGTHNAAKDEVMTERLRVSFDRSVQPADLATDGVLVLPGAPADPELEVGGRRVWSRPGPVRLADDGQGHAVFGETVDLAAALQAAIAQATTTGDLALAVTLRTAAPCVQSLQVQVSYVQVHQVTLPAGGLPLEAAAEGDWPVTLQLPAGAGGWQLVGCELAIQGRIGPGRVLPAVGPATGDVARLLLDPLHAVAARLPSADAARLATLTGLRLPLAALGGDAELAGVLRIGGGDVPDSAASPLPFKPVTLPAGTAPAWVTLELLQPCKPRGDAPLWVELTATRGRLAWPLAVPRAEDPVVPGQPAPVPRNVLIRRASPGPPYRAIVAKVGPPAVEGGAIAPAAICGALRLIGEAPAGQPIAALTPRLGTPAANGPALSPCTPTQAGVVSRASFDPPLAGAVAAGTSPSLPLVIRAAAPGTYTITAAKLLYRQPA